LGTILGWLLSWLTEWRNKKLKLAFDLQPDPEADQMGSHDGIVFYTRKKRIKQCAVLAIGVDGEQ
jgi:hypothetical protein